MMVAVDCAVSSSSTAVVARVIVRRTAELARALLVAAPCRVVVGVRVRSRSPRGESALRVISKLVHYKADASARHHFGELAKLS